MEKASSKTYISKRIYDKYALEKQKIANGAPQEEETKGGDDEDENYLTCEEVDAEDLGEDITKGKS